jgi:hypothetical protein
VNLVCRLGFVAGHIAGFQWRALTFKQTLYQRLCRREGNFNHPPITYTGINVPHPQVGWQSCFSTACSAIFFTYKLNSSFVGAASSANFFLTDCIAVVFQQPALLFFTYKLNNSFVGAASSATFFLKNCIAVVFHKTALPSMPHV